MGTPIGKAGLGNFRVEKDFCSQGRADIPSKILRFNLFLVAKFVMGMSDHRQGLNEIL